MSPTPSENFDSYLTPIEAAAQLESLSDELAKYAVAAEDLEELRQIGRHFHCHLNGLESLHDLLRDVAERILC